MVRASICDAFALVYCVRYYDVASGMPVWAQASNKLVFIQQLLDMY